MLGVLFFSLLLRWLRLHAWRRSRGRRGSASESGAANVRRVRVRTPAVRVLPLPHDYTDTEVLGGTHRNTYTAPPHYY